MNIWNQLNFPNNKRIKEAFVAPRGYMYMSADFKAQEVRETCNQTLDPDLRKLFDCACMSCGEPQPESIRLMIDLDIHDKIAPKDRCPNVVPIKEVCCPKCGQFKWSEPDPHSLTAQRVFEECRTLSLQEIKKKYKHSLRQDAKIIQFTILYGGSSYTLADRLYKDTDNESKKKAQKIIDNYFEYNPYVKSAIEATVEKAKRDGFVETIGGYRRHLPDIQLQELPRKPTPALDEEVKEWKCFGQVDMEWSEEDPKSDRLSSMTCPREKHCPFAADCAYSFRQRNVKSLIARAVRQAFNILIQGSSADHTNLGLKKFYNKRRELAKLDEGWNHVHVISNIYDCLYLLVREDMIDKVPLVASECMENTYDGIFVKHQLAWEPPSASWADIH